MPPYSVENDDRWYMYKLERPDCFFFIVANVREQSIWNINSRRGRVKPTSSLGIKLDKRSTPLALDQVSHILIPTPKLAQPHKPIRVLRVQVLKLETFLRLAMA